MYLEKILRKFFQERKKKFIKIALKKVSIQRSVQKMVEEEGMQLSTIKNQWVLSIF